MRNIAVSLTTKQVANSVAELLGQPKPHPNRLGKTVTRRDGWEDLQPGTLLCLVEKGMGLKRGEKVNRLALVHVTSVRRERLDAITPEDVKLEGFAHFSDLGPIHLKLDYPRQTAEASARVTVRPIDFITFFCATHKGTTPASIITRIEWEYVGGPEAAATVRAALDAGWRSPTVIRRLRMQMQPDETVLHRELHITLKRGGTPHDAMDIDKFGNFEARCHPTSLNGLKSKMKMKSKTGH